MEIQKYIQIDSVTFNQEIIWICLSKILLRRYASPNLNIHRENSPVTQTTLELKLLSWAGWPREKTSPHPCMAMLPNLVLSCLSGHSDPIVLEPLMSPFDTEVCNERQICLKISSDIERFFFSNGFFKTLHTDLKVESNFFDHY